MTDFDIQTSRINSNWKKHKIKEYDGTNCAVTIEDFEVRLRILSIQEINSRGFAEYLMYLSETRPQDLNYAYLS